MCANNVGLRLARLVKPSDAFQRIKDGIVQIAADDMNRKLGRLLVPIHDVQKRLEEKDKKIKALEE